MTLRGTLHASTRSYSLRPFRMVDRVDVYPAMSFHWVLGKSRDTRSVLLSSQWPATQRSAAAEASSGSREWWCSRPALWNCPCCVFVRGGHCVVTLVSSADWTFPQSSTRVQMSNQEDLAIDRSMPLSTLRHFSPNFCLFQQKRLLNTDMISSLVTPWATIDRKLTNLQGKLAILNEVWCLAFSPCTRKPNFSLGFPKDNTAGEFSRSWTARSMSRSFTWTVASSVVRIVPLSKITLALQVRGTSWSSYAQMRLNPQ